MSFAHKSTAMVAMSGGVDSAVAAHLMQSAGYAVTGVTMKLYRDGEPRPHADGGEDDSPDILRARRVAAALDIPHLVCHLEHTFCTRVVDEFVRAYLAGETPNPCVTCNKTVKFGALIDFADAHSLSVVATGHYARIEQNEGGICTVRRALDTTKDQSYMLWSLGQDVLRRVRLPLGGLCKSEVRELAAAQGFTNAHERDSQDICFIPDGNYVDFIRRYAGHTPTPGHFVDADGRVLGEHAGMLHYTIGQRKGLGVAFGRPVYVLDKNARTGEVVLGDNEALLRRTLSAHSVNWISGVTPEGALRVQAKIRYAHDAADATVWQTDEDHIRVEFDTPQRAIARGQSVVLYDGDVLLGGGIIE